MGIRRLSIALFATGLLYALYRAYYGAGGTIGMIGTPTSERHWRAVNLGAAVVLVVVALLPVAMLRLWSRPRLRRVFLLVASALAVGGVMHAVIMDVQRIASLAGVHHIRYPAAEWRARDDHAADLQDLLFNETWFLVEGILWARLVWTALARSRARRRWLMGVVAATVALTCVGLLSAFGIAGRWVVG